ncbi:DUF711 family protein [Thermoproteus tenax]|uniref:DUF711 family protein n=1 Tax=Thermoproteus tenax (strain ATCC 35583 / DSM 2078 / JCM 9277 / NBRC 100435 / Kra 1) TaxID=768679 RepID=G4RLE9_THETK|nr:DUF711 family protein [Thermoproteus tenax]CCC82394.1 conserved hypothetical protein [Thermoproteus tenax Kra 1]
MEIRAVALNLNWDFDVERASKFLREASRLSPRTVRISVATPPKEGLRQVLNALEETGAQYFAIGIYEAEDLEDLVRSYGVFASVTSIERYLEFLTTIDKRGEPELARYVALLLGGVVYNSPYYPAAVVKSEGVSLSLLYADDLSSPDDVAALLKSAERIGESFAESIGERFLGVDGSLSPWGEHSVARAIERLFGVRLGGWGSLAAIKALNDSIRSAGVRSVGFNEVMLPLAEDEELKRLAQEGSLDLYKLASYASVCVAGLDMVPVEADREALRRLLLDLKALAETKARPVGVRIFPASGEYFEVPGFGRTPVLKA